MARQSSEAFQVGDSIVVVGPRYNGELGTVIGLAPASDPPRYRIVFENGEEVDLPAESLARRR